MNSKARPKVVGARATEQEIARIDAACALRTMNRSDYIRAATMAQVERDLRAAVEESRHQVAEAR